MTTSTTAGSAILKQIKVSPAERINGKVKPQIKQDATPVNNVSVNGTLAAVPNGPTGKPAAAPQGEPLSPDQRRRVSGRPQMTTEEQRLALRKRVEQFIPTINVRNSTTNILAKYKDAAPSLIVHLHPTHFRFDQQDGVFSYNSPMKAFLEYVRDEQIPHEVADVLKTARIKYYDACLIVEVRDHRPRGQPVSTTSRGPFITPSQNTNSTPAPPTVQSKEKEPPRVYRTLLRPTEQSLWQDFGPLAEASQGEFTDWMGLQVEGGLMWAMHPRLVLDLPRPGMSRKRIFERVFDQSNSIPPRKKARRESSKAVDDSAERAAEEKLMLLGDIKHDKDFQPRFQLLVHKEEWKKKKAEEEKATKVANGNQPRDIVSMVFNDAADSARPKPKAITVDSIQAQAAQVQLNASVRIPQIANGAAGGPNPAQLAQQAAQQGALAAAVQAQQNQTHQAAQRRGPLPRVASQEQLPAARVPPQAPNIGRQLQPAVNTSNAPTPMSSSPQAPLQRLPATPRNLPGTPRPPGTPQPQAAQTKHPTPQPNGQALTPASSQPSPMLKSVSQTDEAQLPQVNGPRPFSRDPSQMNGMPQSRQPAQPPQTHFFEVLQKMGVPMTPQQFLSLPPPQQNQWRAKVQSHIQQVLAMQGNLSGNPQTVQAAYQQAQNYLQQAQRTTMPAQYGQGMTPEQQRIFAQQKAQMMGSADQEMLRQQLAQQGRLPPSEVQAMLHQQLLNRQQNTQPQQAPQALGQAQARQMPALHPGQIKLPNGQVMTATQLQMYRNQQLAQAQARAQINHTAAQNFVGVNHPVNAFLSHLPPDRRAEFIAMDPQKQHSLLQALTANQPQLAQQQQQGGAPQLQYNPMAAQNMSGAGRMPGQMVGMAQAQAAPNGLGGPAMMRQSTSGGVP